MRVSTSLIFDRGVAAMQERQSELLSTQQRLATGRRILSPADDPVAAAQVLQLTEADETNTRLRVNRDYAQNQLALAEVSIAQAVDILQAVRERAVAAGNGAYTDAELQSIANDVAGRFEQLLAIANTTDAQGRYLFSGYQGATLPFVVDGAGVVQYRGDEGERLVQAAPSRRIALNVTGAALFQRVPAGNGAFTWAPGAGNAGSGVIGPGSVVDGTLVTGHDYRITFTVAGGVTTYDVVDMTSATTVLAAQPWSGGPAALEFDGIAVNLEGRPANGDTFAIVPSTDQSVFATLRRLIGALRGGGGTPFANSLGIALTDLDRALDTAVAQRASVGVRLREIDATNGVGEAFGLQYQSARSQLDDADYAKVVSDLSRQQLTLQAAQQSFVRVTQLSLFDFL